MDQIKPRYTEIYSLDKVFVITSVVTCFYLFFIPLIRAPVSRRISAIERTKIDTRTLVETRSLSLSLSSQLVVLWSLEVPKTINGMEFLGAGVMLFSLFLAFLFIHF